MIKIQLATEKSLCSLIISEYTWSPYSHVDFVLPDGRLLGARLNGGVQARPPGYATFSQTLRLEAPDAPDSVYEYALDQIGASYDWRAIVGMGLRRDWRDQHRWFCSELVAWSFERAGYPLLRSNHVNRITPRDICISPLWREPVDTGVAP